jgi:hypothetical protein
MDLEIFGKRKKIQDRRLSILTLEEKGLKPREISKSLEIDIGDVYNDLKWARKNLPREIREQIWDMQFLREIEKEMRDAKHPLHKIGYRNILLKVRQDMRKRSGMYIERIEHSGEIKQEVKLDDSQLKDYAGTIKEVLKGRSRKNPK